MVVFLIIAGQYILSCIPGVACVDVIGRPEVILATGGFELVVESMGVYIYKKTIGKKKD